MRTLLVVLGALATLVLLPGAPAQAHGGPLKMEVSGDGADGVTVRAMFNDGHPAEPDIRLMLLASGEGGRSVGPVQLTQSGEGRGFYSTGSLLAPGRWQIVVSAPAPYTARVEISYDAQAPQSAPAARPEVQPEPAAGKGWLWLSVGLLTVGAAVAFGVLLLRRPTRREHR